jgi:LacI family transcriptional regulator
MHSDKLPHVAVLVDTATSWGRRLIRGITHYSEQHGPWHLSVEACGQSDFLKLPFGWKGHGIIARIGSPRMLRALEATHLPVVNVSAIDLPNNLFPQIITDYRESAKLALQHFCDRGFRRFAYSGLPRTGYGRRHRDEFCEAVEAMGFKCDVYQPLRVRSGALHEKKRVKHIITWLRSLTKPVGIFTWATDPGRELLEACRVANISVPYEVAVLGGNYDELLCDTAWPPMSGIVVPSEQIGHDAAALLARMMRRHKPSSKTILIPPTGIVEKRSTDTLAIDDPDVAQALTFIRGQAFQSIQVSDILKAVPLSRRSIERRFSQVLGRSPTEEIRRVRMAKAKSLLAETTMPMQAIANACGFSTYNYLTRVFTNENGITPREFRKRVQGR